MESKHSKNSENRQHFEDLTHTNADMIFSFPGSIFHLEDAEFLLAGGIISLFI